MAEDNVEKFLSEQRSMEERKQALIAELLKQREGVIKDFDEKLAKLGYQAKDGKPKRSHHKPTPPADPKAKTKA